MLITVKLFATLRKNRKSEFQMNIYQGMTVKNILDQVDIPEDEAAVVFINGRISKLDQSLSNDDTVSIFPPVGGG